MQDGGRIGGASLCRECAATRFQVGDDGAGAARAFRRDGGLIGVTGLGDEHSGAQAGDAAGDLARGEPRAERGDRAARARARDDQRERHRAGVEQRGHRAAFLETELVQPACRRRRELDELGVRDGTLAGERGGLAVPAGKDQLGPGQAGIHPITLASW